jgi:2-oxo-4-hydroxy-4-carboxy--5-ureidoimidazoline (OHCU) decarboxylase
MSGLRRNIRPEELRLAEIAKIARFRLADILGA